MPANFDLYGLPTSFLNGSLTATIIDPDGSPNLVLERTRSFSIKVDWTIQGIIAPGLGGDWQLRAFVESIGPGPEMAIGTANLPLSSVPPAPTRNYTTTMNVPANSVPQDGTYKLTMVLTHTNMGIPDHMAGFVEGPVIQFYTP